MKDLIMPYYYYPYLPQILSKSIEIMATTVISKVQKFYYNSMTIFIVPYHACWIIMISMNAEHWQTNIEVRIFIIYMTKSVKRSKLYKFCRCKLSKGFRNLAKARRFPVNI